MRILLTSPAMAIGGAERVVTMLVAGLVQRGHEVVLAAPYGDRDADLVGIPHLRIELDDHGRAATGAVLTAAQLAGAVRRSAPEVIHAQNVKSSAISRAASFAAWPRRPPPVLATFHGVLPREYPRGARVLGHVQHVACVSSSALDQLLAAGLPPERASLVRNAITPAVPLDPGRRAELEDELGLGGAPTVAIVGRIVAQKAHWRFVAAARGVAEELPGTRFLIVGEGPLRARVEDEVREAGLSELVRFTGPRADAREIVALTDLIVFSSDWEGLSITALEALAAGTPVVSTDVQGMAELLMGRDPVGGSVVPLDDGTALAARIVALLGDERARLAMGAAGQELMRRDYSIGGMIDAYERLYEQLAKR